MPYSKISEARIQELDGVKLTLSQVSAIARMADSIGTSDKVKGWAVAVSSFKKSHTVKDGKWVSKKDKEFSELIVSKEGDRYKLVTISTAAVVDLEGETFTTKAMDYDIEEAQKTGEYPQFFLHHNKHLAIGKVEKMERIGIFMVDTGYSYTDAFSKEVCEKLLVNNDGKWRVSRGFYPLYTSFNCECKAELGVELKHIRAGFVCPECKKEYTSYRGMPGVKYLKVKTFDVSITDNPAVPFTSASASAENKEEFLMSKQALKDDLVNKDGLDEAAVNARLDSIPEAEIKELPAADVVNKACAGGEAAATSTRLDEEDEEEDMKKATKSLLEAVLPAITQEVTKQLSTLTINVDDVNMAELPEFKELTGVLESMKSTLKALEDRVSKVEVSDVARINEVETEMPRKAAIRLARVSEVSKALDAAPVIETNKEADPDNFVLGQDGKKYKSVTEAIQAQIAETR